MAIILIGFFLLFLKVGQNTDVMRFPASGVISSFFVKCSSLLKGIVSKKRKETLSFIFDEYSKEFDKAKRAVNENDEEYFKNVNTLEKKMAVIDVFFEKEFGKLAIKNLREFTSDNAQNDLIFMIEKMHLDQVHLKKLFETIVNKQVKKFRLSSDIPFLVFNQFQSIDKEIYTNIALKVLDGRVKNIFQDSYQRVSFSRVKTYSRIVKSFSLFSIELLIKSLPTGGFISVGTRLIPVAKNINDLIDDELISIILLEGYEKAKPKIDEKIKKWVKAKRARMIVSDVIFWASVVGTTAVIYDHQSLKPYEINDKEIVESSFELMIIHLSQLEAALAFDGKNIIKEDRTIKEQEILEKNMDLYSSQSEGKVKKQIELVQSEIMAMKERQRKEFEIGRNKKVDFYNNTEDYRNILLKSASDEVKKEAGEDSYLAESLGSFLNSFENDELVKVSIGEGLHAAVASILGRRVEESGDLKVGVFKEVDLDFEFSIYAAGRIETIAYKDLLNLDLKKYPKELAKDFIGEKQAEIEKKKEEARKADEKKRKALEARRQALENRGK